MATYKNITASTLIKTGQGTLAGIFVASASATPTIKVWDSTAGSGNVLINTFTPAAPQYYPMGAFGGAQMGANFPVGLFVTISGTVDCTVFFD